MDEGISNGVVGRYATRVWVGKSQKSAGKRGWRGHSGDAGVNRGVASEVKSRLHSHGFYGLFTGAPVGEKKRPLDFVCGLSSRKICIAPPGGPAMANRRRNTGKKACGDEQRDKEGVKNKAARRQREKIIEILLTARR